MSWGLGKSGHRVSTMLSTWPWHRGAWRWAAWGTWLALRMFSVVLWGSSPPKSPLASVSPAPLSAARQAENFPEAFGGVSELCGEGLWPSVG